MPVAPNAIESIETISAPNRNANSTPTADLPEAVGPVRNQWELKGEEDMDVNLSGATGILPVL